MLQITETTLFHGHVLSMERKSVKSFRVHFYGTPTEMLTGYLDGHMNDCGFNKVGQLCYTSVAPVSWDLLVWMLNEEIKTDAAFFKRVRRIEVWDSTAKVALAEPNGQRTMNELDWYQSVIEKNKAERAKAAAPGCREDAAQTAKPMQVFKMKKVIFKIRGATVNPDYSSEYVKICGYFLKRGYVRSRGVFIYEGEIGNDTVYETARSMKRRGACCGNTLRYGSICCGLPYVTGIRNGTIRKN